MLKDRVKIFSERMDVPTFHTLEMEINKWLESHPGIQITKRQTRLVCSGAPYVTLVIVLFYAEQPPASS